MKRYRLTKAQVLKAIRDEVNLGSGKWMQTQLLPSEANRDRQIAEVQECKVCAIGAILRDILPPDTPLSRFDQTASQLAPGVNPTYSCPTLWQVQNRMDAEQPYIRQGQVWSSLARVFENLWSYHHRPDVTTDADDVKRERVRADLLKYVEEAFPEDVQLSVSNGTVFKPSVKLLETP